MPHAAHQSHLLCFHHETLGVSGPEPAHRHALPWVRIVSIVAVMATLVSALWIVIRQVDDTDVGNLDPTEAVASPEASPPGTPPPATPPGAATPEGDDGPDWPPGSLPALLEYAPDRLADDSLPLNAVASYADIAGWMSAQGVTTPVSLADPALPAWEGELDNLAIPLSLRERGLDPVWQSTYGFDLTEVEQVLIIGQAPDYVTILRGTFDPDGLQAAWVASGYQAVEVEGATVWSLFPGDTIDLSAQESRPAMGTLNNVVMLDDGTLVAAAKTSRVGSTLEVINGNAPSLAENDDIAALLLPGTGAEGVASAVISKGSLLQTSEAAMSGPMSTPSSTPEPGSVATPEAEGGMPEVNVALMSIPLPPTPPPLPPSPGEATPVAGGTEGGRMTMLMVLDDMIDARVADEVITSRLESERSSVTGDPYSSRVGEPQVTVLDGDDRAVVMVSGVLTYGSSDWLDILRDRDLGFALWLPEELSKIR